MERRSIAEILAEVSPGTTVILGGRRHRKSKERLDKTTKLTTQLPEPYILRQVTDEDWDKAAGVRCARCGEESHILFNHSQGRMCKKCYQYLWDNWVDEGEEFKAKLLDDGSIILYRGQTRGR